LRVKLRHLDDWNIRRKVIAAQYLDGLANCDLALPHVPDWIEPVWHLFIVQHPQRNLLQQRLNAEDVGTLIHYPIPPYKQQAYSDIQMSNDAFPLASLMADKILSLPIGPQLAKEQVTQVITAVCRCVN